MKRGKLNGFSGSDWRDAVLGHVALTKAGRELHLSSEAIRLAWVLLDYAHRNGSIEFGLEPARAYYSTIARIRADHAARAYKELEDAGLIRSGAKVGSYYSARKPFKLTFPKPLPPEGF